MIKEQSETRILSPGIPFGGVLERAPCQSKTCAKLPPPLSGVRSLAGSGVGDCYRCALPRLFVYVYEGEGGTAHAPNDDNGIPNDGDSPLDTHTHTHIQTH